MEQQCAVNSTLAQRPMSCQDMFLRLYQPKLLSAVLQSSLYGNSKLHPLDVEELTIEYSGQSRPVELFHYWWICSNCHWPTNMHCTWCCMAHWCSSIHIFIVTSRWLRWCLWRTGRVADNHTISDRGLWTVTDGSSAITSTHPTQII